MNIHDGVFVPRDTSKAKKYFLLAADQGYSNSQFALGLIYIDPNFTNVDVNKAIYYFSLAANLNHSLAQYYLGCFYYNGNLIPRKINKSIMKAN